jgi:stress response protein SCP2
VIKTESQVVLNTLTKHNFQDAIKKWQKHWEQCICVEGDNSEGGGGGGQQAQSQFLTRGQQQSQKLWIAVCLAAILSQVSYFMFL